MKVDIIPKKQTASKEIKKVCAYVRVSTDSMEQEESLENQTAFFRRFITEKPKLGVCWYLC